MKTTAQLELSGDMSMRTFVLTLALGAASLLGAFPASAARPTAPWGPEVLEACAKAAHRPCSMSAIARRELGGDVAEYSFTLKIGPGQHDVIGLHRVIKEDGVRPAHSDSRSDSGIFFVHGDALGFDAAFLASAASPSVPDSRALPVFLAENDVEVWGIDQRWALVDAGTTDFRFMQSWGLAMSADDVGIGLAVAAKVRRSDEPMDLLAWSRGGEVAYTYLNTEASLPAARRRVKGFIPVDIYVKTDVPALVEAACARLAQRQQSLAQGVYRDTTGQLISTIGRLALSSPDAPSPIVPSLSNLQAGYLAGEATFSFQGGLEPAPFYHWAGGAFDAHGLPTGLSFTENAYFFDFLAGAAPYMPVQLIADAEAVICDRDDLPFVDNLGGITIPVLYIGAGGGVGTFGLHSLSLLGSPDRESLIVDPQPQSRLSDFGHTDLFLATNARTQVWQPLLDWIRGVRTR
jgi:hypothetical protein